MNSMNIIERNIIEALQGFETLPLREAAIKFLNTLGYHSTRTSTETRDRRLRETLESEVEVSGILSDQRAISDWQDFHILFQITDDEANFQRMIFESAEIDLALMDSYVFAVLELSGEDYSRTQLANITRFINKKIEQPIMVIFRYSDVLSLGIINRRWNERARSKQVLEQVTLIKDIRLKKLHAAHRRILADLWLERLAETQGVRNFDTLHIAWADVLDTEPLNKKFYSDLYEWYQWAVSECQFPDDNDELQVIRLITRLLFIWFLREKGLVPQDIFEKDKVESYLNCFDMETSDYYRSILQNLFFATLNTPIDERCFGAETCTYHYADLLANPESLLRKLKQVPFVNGGLFDCHVTQECFTDDANERQNLRVPTKFFFQDKSGIFSIFDRYKFTIEEHTPIEQEVALDPELLGLVFEHLLAEINPETREKAEDARKKTGSYYTPRAIVNYMVEEALVKTLSEKCQPDDGSAKRWNEKLRYLFNHAHTYNDPNERLNSYETVRVMEAISELKILDPAVGSGAFPMGILHKLTLALRRLDPDNSQWKKLQKKLARQRAAAAFNTSNQKERDAKLTEISDTFERYRDSDFGRKLYLIQNSIFGVDIQTIACQIAKLRFFISLSIEQEREEDVDNFGIKPLPNLETRFIAANTLINLKGQKMFTNTTVQDLEEKLLGNRERHFHATTYSQKLACRKLDKRLRRKLATELKRIGMPYINAEKIAHWDIYDQNGKAGWFDSEWMFGITGGFDIVIGNPPYIKEYTFKEAFDGLRESPYYQGKMDIWYMFTCEGLDLVGNRKGLVTFIAQNNWVTSDGASKMRNKIIQDAQILSLIDFGSFRIFESGIQTMVMIFRKNADIDNYQFDYRRLHGNDLNIKDVTSLLSKKPNNKAEYLNPTIKRSRYTNRLLTFSNSEIEPILEKISLKRNFILSKSEVAQGIVYPQDSVNKKSKGVLGSGFEVGDGIFVLSQEEKKLIPFTEKELDIIKPVYTTKELGRYYGNPANEHWAIYTDSSFKNERKIKDYPNIKKHLDQFREVITSHNKPYGLHRARDPYFFQGEKIISVRKCARPTFTYVEFDSYVSQTFFLIKTKRTNLKYLMGLLNSKLITFWLKHKGKMQGTNYQIDKQPLLATPLISPTLEVQMPIATLVNQILVAKATGSNTGISDLEKKIDDLVYALYGLTDDQIAIVEEAVE